MTEPRKPYKPPNLVDLNAESKKLRAVLERAALDGTIDLAGKDAELHARLDEIERLLYVARRVLPEKTS